MKEEMIGKLIIMPIINWNNFKKNRPLIKDELDYAVIKELDNKYAIIEEKRLNKVLNMKNV